jgi:hypothetical protein
MNLNISGFLKIYQENPSFIHVAQEHGVIYVKININCFIISLSFLVRMINVSVQSFLAQMERDKMPSG